MCRRKRRVRVTGMTSLPTSPPTTSHAHLHSTRLLHSTSHLLPPPLPHTFSFRYVHVASKVTYLLFRVMCVDRVWKWFTISMKSVLMRKIGSIYYIYMALGTTLWRACTIRRQFWVPFVCRVLCSKKQLRSLLATKNLPIRIPFKWAKISHQLLSVFSRRNLYLHYPPVHLDLRWYERFEISLTLIKLIICAAVGKRYWWSRVWFVICTAKSCDTPTITELNTSAITTL